MATESGSEIDLLRRVRPEQGDMVARQLQANVRRALVDGASQPVKIGRFTVLEVVGSGGMGVVYAAYDPKLDRRVAIKVLHAHTSERLLAEARSLAKLSHPNVVAVFDASDLDDEPEEMYIAMEFVAGTSLRLWLAAKPRRSDEIVDVMVKAGRGLAAAHAAGLVHGDFKPENVLVGDDGAVKVVDFGLARRADSDSDHCGGTPAYMAPEQLTGVVEARSDQYSFAVTLYEALTGSRPEAGRPARGLPGRLADVLARALDRDPTRRYRSMEALLDELVPRPRSQLWIALAAVAIGGGVVATLVLDAEPDGCGAGDERVARILSPEVRARIEPRTARVLADYGDAWSSMARDACEATRRGEQSAAMLDLRMACLDRRLDEFDALVETLASGDGSGIDAAFALTPIEPCLDRDRLAGVLPPPRELAEQVAALRSRLDRARGQQHTTSYRQALADVEDVVAEARPLAYAPLLGEALLELGALQNHAGLREQADGSFREAIRFASIGGDDSTLTDSWKIRAFVATELDRYPEALAYAEAAESLATRARNPEVSQAQIRSYVGEVYRRRGQFDTARTTLEEALPLFERARGPNHPDVGDALSRLADVCMRQGDLPAARRYAERSVAVLEASVGPDNQATALALQVLSGVHMAEDDLEGCLVMSREVLRRLRAGAGEDHHYLASAHLNIGNILRRLGRLDEAKVELEQALAIRMRAPESGQSELIKTMSELARLVRQRGDTAEAIRLQEDVLARRIALFGPVHHAVADTLNDLGNAYLDLGDLDRAADHFRRALDNFTQSLGEKHSRVAMALNNLGDVELKRGDFAAALTACEKALAIDEAALGARHPDLAYDLTCVGEARLGLGQSAAEVLERAVALREAGSAPASELARTRFALARALWPGDRARARELATTARSVFAAEGKLAADELAAVEKWLASHRA